MLNDSAIDSDIFSPRQDQELSGFIFFVLANIFRTNVRVRSGACLSEAPQRIGVPSGPFGYFDNRMKA
jgi:hypothetical protein